MGRDYSATDAKMRNLDLACGTQIPAERLELVPETPYCVEDAAKD